MTETLQDRLRHGAKNIHSIGPDRAAGLLAEAADQVDKYDVLVTSIEALRDMVLKEHAAAEQAEAERRAFLERAVCHPGPPLSETEDYDPDAPVGELEAAILERLDHETEDRRDLWDIRKRCEEALGRTPDPARKTMQVVLDLLAWTRTMGLSPPAQPGDLGILEHADGRTTLRLLVPIVRPEHFTGPFPAISGYVKRTRAARAATIDQALRMLKPGQSLAVHDEPERVDILFLDPGQDPPLGQTWTIYGPLSAEYREAFNASLDRQRCAAAGGELRPAVAAGMATLRANSADRSPGPHPKAAEFQKLIDGLRNKHEGAVERDQELVMPLDIWVPVQAGIDARHHIVGNPMDAMLMWARLPIWRGPASLDLRFDNRLIDVTELGDRTARYEQETRGIGTLWLALDPKTAARVLEYVGRGIDHPVMLGVVWAGYQVQFGASLARLADGERAPEARHIGAGREWYGYTIAVDKYPDLAARLFNERNQASARPHGD